MSNTLILNSGDRIVVPSDAVPDERGHIDASQLRVLNSEGVDVTELRRRPT